AEADRGHRRQGARRAEHRPSGRDPGHRLRQHHLLPRAPARARRALMLPWIDVLGFWIGVFLTFSILSYLYKDNPFYKLAEHTFVGVSIGYVITQQYYNVIKPNLLEHLAREHWYEYLIPSWYWVPLLLVFLLFVRSASRRLAWVGRYPLAFVVALYAGLQI